MTPVHLQAARRAAAIAVAMFMAFIVVPSAPASALGGDSSTEVHNEPSQPSARAVLSSVSPAMLTATSTLQVSVDIRNTGQTPLTGATATLRSATRASNSRSALDNWAEAGADRQTTGQAVSTRTLPTIAPGGHSSVTFTASAAELGVRTYSKWGPRGISVVVMSGDVRLDVLRTFVVWGPPDDGTKVGLGVVAAVTGPAGEATPASATALNSATAPDGRLGRLLTATNPWPQIGWVVDPELITATTGSADATTKNWGAEVIAGQQGRGMATLRPADPDIAAFAHAGRSIPTSTSTWKPAPGTRTDLAWPADTVPDTITAYAAANAGTPFVMVGGKGMSTNDDLTYTPSSTAKIAGTTATAVVADPILTDQMLSPTGSHAPDSDSADSTAIRTQRLLAETAVIARERPNDLRTVLIALPRSWQPDPKAVNAQMTALQSAPWVSFSSLSQVLSTPATSGLRGDLPSKDSSRGEISRDALDQVDAIKDAAGDFAAIAADPSQITAPIDQAADDITSVAYRSDPSGRQKATDQLQERVDTLQSSVTASAPSRMNIFGETSKITVVVSNKLDQPVTVTVHLISSDPRLSIKTQDAVLTVPARGQKQTVIAVHAVGTGNVTVTGQLAGPSSDVGNPFTTKVHVSAAWDQIGSPVIVAILALMFIGGIWRTIRRGGRSRRRVPAGATDPTSTGTGKDDQ